MERVRLAVVINAIVLAGAERMLARVLARLRPEEFDVHVFTIGMSGPFTEHLEQLGIPNRLYEFLRPKLPNPLHLLTLARDLRRFHPDVVQGWMYLGNLYGGVAAKLARRDLPVAWNIRHSTLDPQIDSRSMRWSAWLGGQLSGFVPDRIVLCAEAARAAHLRVGYAPEKLEVIPNGFDLSEVRPDLVARQRIRTELGIADDTPLIGLIGRLHQHKDHRTFVRAARVVAEQFPQAHFVGAGEEQTYSAADLWSWVDEVGLRDRFHWLGVRRDVPAIDASLDVLVCSSTTEGFPNVVGEAMACGVPCVATDVGECAEVVGDTGRIVPKQDPQRLGEAIVDLLRMPHAERTALGDAARRRVVERYDIQRIVDRYQKLWRELARTKDRAASDSKRRAA
ncbi:MAG: GT4 family glycosyltransferase PelF [Planctomycetaceae bacterium]|nr:GT4 family glycosyltransferase PelF [Planctomycetaceae bacterium]